jgi:hypothetical protein
MTTDTHTSESPVVEMLKSWLSVLQSIATIAAIICGGIWFYMQRSTKPQVKLDQTITQRTLTGSNDTLITIDVRATNIGKTKVTLNYGQFDLDQLNPTGVGRLWGSPLADNLNLEPGESDQALFKTLILDSSIKTVQAHSDYPVPGTNKFWNLLTAVDVGPNVTATKVADSSVR